MKKNLKYLSISDEKKFLKEQKVLVKIAEEKGIIPPQFIIDRVLSEMSGFVGNKEKDSIHIKTDNLGPV